MNITKTISIEKNGACLMEQDVICVIDYDINDNEVFWNIDEYRMSAQKRVWDDMAGKWVYEWTEVAAPPKLAAVFDEFIDRKSLDEDIVERLICSGELEMDGYSSERASYRASAL